MGKTLLRSFPSFMLEIIVFIITVPFIYVKSGIQPPRNSCAFVQYALNRSHFSGKIEDKRKTSGGKAHFLEGHPLYYQENLEVLVSV